MTDHINNTTTTIGHIQDKLVQDSITNNQDITAQVKARQNTAASINNNDFTHVEDLPIGTPQGQQTTMPNSNTENRTHNSQVNNAAQTDSQASKQTLFNQRDDIHNPHTSDTDGMKKPILVIRPLIKRKSKRAWLMSLPLSPKNTTS